MALSERRIFRVFHDNEWKDVPEDELPSIYRNSFFFLNASTMFLGTNYNDSTSNRNSDQSSSRQNPNGSFQSFNYGGSANSSSSPYFPNTNAFQRNNSARNNSNPFGPSPTAFSNVSDAASLNDSIGSNFPNSNSDERPVIQRIFQNDRWVDVYDLPEPPLFSPLSAMNDLLAPTIINSSLPGGRVADYLQSIESFDFTTLSLNNSVLPRERLSHTERSVRTFRMISQIEKQRETFIKDFLSASIPFHAFLQEIARTGEFKFMKKRSNDCAENSKANERGKEKETLFFVPDSFESYYLIIHCLHLFAVRLSGYSNEVYLKEFEQEVVNSLINQHNHSENFEDFRFARNFNDFPICPQFLSSLSTFPSESSILKNENKDCSICLDELHTSSVLRFPCSHMFHDDCIHGWIANSSNCPVCRSVFPIDKKFIEDNFQTNRCGLLVALVWNEVRTLCESKVDDDFVFVLDSLVEVGEKRGREEGEEEEDIGLRRRLRYEYGQPGGGIHGGVEDGSDSEEGEEEEEVEEASGNGEQGSSNSVQNDGEEDDNGDGHDDDDEVNSAEAEGCENEEQEEEDEEEDKYSLD